jgi:AcrR family transcriptional regulator
MSTEKNQGKPCRPRNETIRQKILQTTVRLLIEKGCKEATMKNIAVSARVGKQTLYRWWRNRADLLMEALLYYAEENVDAVVHISDQPGLKQFLSATFQSITKESGAVLRALIAESIVDESFAQAFFKGFIKQRQHRLELEIKKLQSAKNPDSQKMGVAVDMIFGSMWYRLIFGHRSLDETLANELASMVEHLVG